MKTIIKISGLVVLLVLGINLEIHAQHINFKKYQIDSDCRTTIELFNLDNSIHYILFDNTLVSNKYLVLHNEYFKPKELDNINTNDIFSKFIFIPYPNIPSGKYTLKLNNCIIEQPINEEIMIIK